MSKQYLLLCDEIGMAKLQTVFSESTIQFIEVNGMNFNTDNKFNLLVTPVVPPVNPAIFPMQPPVTEIPPQVADD